MTPHGSASRRARGGSDAQLLILAGIILTLGFLVIAITVSEIESQRGEVVRDAGAALRDEFLFVRKEFGLALNSSVAATASNETFRAAFNDTATTFTELQLGRGLEFNAVLAGNGTLSPKNEYANFTAVSGSTRFYRTSETQHVTTHDGKKAFGTFVYDETSDGILHANGRLQGAIVYLLLADAGTTYAEVMVYDIGG